MDAPNRGITEPILLLLGFAQTPILLKILVEFLYVPAGELLQLDFSDPGNDV
jgi:hypothetical protein